MTWGSRISKYESHPWKFATARPKICAGGIKKKEKESEKKI